MSLKVDVNRVTETADQAEQLLFQARLENKRAVVVQTDSGRAIRITKPNNILTQFFSDITGRTQREQSQIKEFVASLRQSDAKLSSRSAQVVMNPSAAGVAPHKTAQKNLHEVSGKNQAQEPQDSKNNKEVEDDELDIADGDAVEIEGIVVTPHQTEQKKAEKIYPKTKASGLLDVLPGQDKHSRKFAERAKAEERKAEQRDINNEAAQTEEELVELALKRKSEADKAFEARGEHLEAAALKNRALNADRQNQTNIKSPDDMNNRN